MPTLASSSFLQVHRDALRRALLACGVLSSVLYVTTDLVASWTWTEYRYADQAVSELSAIGAPTRQLWQMFGVVYGVLLFAFACGVWTTAWRRSLRVVGALLFVMTFLGVAWGFFPMHMRGTPTSLTDTMHAAFAAVQVALTLCAIGFAAVGLGKGFRIYSIASIVVMLGAGAATFWYASRFGTELATPGIGLLERVNVYGYLLWIAMLAVALTRRREAAP